MSGSVTSTYSGLGVRWGGDRGRGMLDIMSAVISYVIRSGGFLKLGIIISLLDEEVFEVYGPRGVPPPAPGGQENASHQSRWRG